MLVRSKTFFNSLAVQYFNSPIQYRTIASEEVGAYSLNICWVPNWDILCPSVGKYLLHKSYGACIVWTMKRCTYGSSALRIQPLRGNFYQKCKKTAHYGMCPSLLCEYIWLVAGNGIEGAMGFASRFWSIPRMSLQAGTYVAAVLFAKYIKNN